MRITILLITLFLSGCTSYGAIQDAIAEAQAEDPNADKLAAVLHYGVKDAAAAYQAAVAADDQPAMVCWPVLGMWLQQLAAYREAVESAQDARDGVLLKYQRARNIRRQLAGGGAPEGVRIACSAMIDDSTDFLSGLVRRVGGL